VKEQERGEFPMMRPLHEKIVSSIAMMAFPFLTGSESISQFCAADFTNSHGLKRKKTVKICVIRG
jgi:hypothetical protein